VIDHRPDRPQLRMLTLEDAPSRVRITDSLFEISRMFELLSEQFERLFVAWSDEIHDNPDDSDESV
jgi:hypothetical protein